jgi:hypothetical protein
MGAVRCFAQHDNSGITDLLHQEIQVSTALQSMKRDGFRIISFGVIVFSAIRKENGKGEKAQAYSNDTFHNTQLYFVNQVINERRTNKKPFISVEAQQEMNDE